jgi:lysophospholipase L1-like esterase
MRVLVFGASITQGFWDTEGGWVGRLRRYYDTQSVKDIKREDDYPDIFNLGVSGDTSQDLLKRMESEIKARMWGDEKPAIIFSIGTNNAAVEGGGKELSTPDDYFHDLKKILATALDYTDKIMFVGLPSCDEKLTTPVSWVDIHYTNKRMFEFEQVMRGFCEGQQIPHVPTFETFQEKLKTGHGLFADGLHPNNEGHELIFQLVRPELDKLLAS